MVKVLGCDPRYAGSIPVTHPKVMAGSIPVRYPET